MKYKPTEIAQVKALFLALVFHNHIKIKGIDTDGNPEPLYTSEAERQLSQLITGFNGFSWPCHVENASREATTEQMFEMAAVYRGTFDKADMLERFWKIMQAQITAYAMLELTEQLFDSVEIAQMVMTHCDYLDLLQDAIRRDRVNLEEIEAIRHFDDKERVADQRAA
jgi:hypothetical protein